MDESVALEEAAESHTVGARSRAIRGSDRMQPLAPWRFGSTTRAASTAPVFRRTRRSSNYHCPDKAIDKQALKSPLKHGGLFRTYPRPRTATAGTGWCSASKSFATGRA